MSAAQPQGARIEELSPADRVLWPFHDALRAATTADVDYLYVSDQAEAATASLPSSYRSVEAAFQLAEAQMLVAQAEIMKMVEAGVITNGDGLRTLAGLPTEVVPGMSLIGTSQHADARLEIVNHLLGNGEDEPAIVILPNGYTFVFPGGATITPQLSSQRPVMNFGFDDARHRDRVIAFSDLTKAAGSKIIPAEVIAGRQEIGAFLRRDAILGGNVPDGTSHSYNQVSGAIMLLGNLAETEQDLGDFGFSQAEVDHLKRLWANLATERIPTGRAASMQQLMTALPVIDREGALEHLFGTIETMGKGLFKEMATDGVKFTGFSRRYIELYEALHGPQDAAGREEAFRQAARLALIAHDTPDTV